MKDQKPDNIIHFGIGLRLSLAIGIVSIAIAGLSFGVATRLYKIITIAAVMDKNWSVIEDLMDEATEKELADILAQGKRIYESLPEDDRTDPTDPIYRSRYDALLTPGYEAVLTKLDQSVGVPRVMWADLRFKDEERNRYVYLMHTGAKADGTYGLGYWEEDDDRKDLSIAGVSVGDANEERMEFLPQWVGEVTSCLPASVSYVSHIVDHLLMLNSRGINDLFSVLYPIKSADTGQTLGYLSIGEYYENYQTYSIAFAVVFAVSAVPYFIIVVLVIRMLVNRSIATPIQKLAKAAVAYGADEDRQKSGGYFKKIPIRSHDEVLLLRDSMADMEESLVTYMDHLKQMTAKQERYKAEMDMSANIQLGMLPQTLADDGKERDFAISASIRPARSVGGDFYDFFMIDDERVGIVIADVSGKGMPAALFMMIAKVVLATIAKEGRSVAEVMRRTNLLLCDNNPETLFVTIWFGVYHTKDHTITYVNAGHDHPAVYRAGEGTFSLAVEENDFPIGFYEEASFTERKLALAPGDRLFLYTDGIPEAHDASDEMYGEERMFAALNRSVSSNGEAFLEAVSADVHGFIGEAEQFDDMTMVLLEIKEP